MKSKLLLALACLLAALPAATSFAQYYNQSGLTSARDLRRMGLEREWFAQVRVSSLKGGIGYLTQHVSGTEAETLFEVRYEEGIERFSERELNAFGEEIGKEEAKKKADARANVLKAEGFKATVTERVVPEIMLYATTTRAMLHALDGRTGATRWTAPLGNPEYPTEAPGANDSYVAAVNGTHVMLFDKQDGRQVWRRQTAGVPGAGPAVNDSFVFAPMISGTIEAYPVEETAERPQIYRSFGRAVYQPVATNDTVSWSTDSGKLYVARGQSKGARFRLETREQVSATPTILPTQEVIAASLDGYVYKLHEIGGDILWRYSTGVAIEHQPVVIDKAVYVITTDGGMYRLDLETGERVWWTPGVEKFLAASKTRIYCTTSRRELIALDMETGGRVGSLRMGEQEVLLTNDVTDRIFIATSSGLVQCLREDLPEYDVPYYHTGIGEEGKQRQEVQREEDPAAADPGAAPPADNGNPFNPDAPPANNENPFAPPPANNNANPFEAAPPAGGNDANPFDPAENPFDAGS